MRQTLLLSLFLGLIFGQCTPKLSTTGSSSEEDFSAFRTKYQYERERYQGQAAPKVMEIMLESDSNSQNQDITLALNEVLDFIPPEPEIEEKLIKIEGWRIQVYRGNSREEASRARQKSYELFPNVTPYLFYRTPTYRVRIGDFLEPYEYKRIYKIVKKEFPNALVVPDVVNVEIIKPKESPKTENREND